jgi:hypothetical protein
LIHLYCSFIELYIILTLLLEDELRLALEGKAFRVPELGVVGGDLESGVVVFVGQVVHLIWLPVQVNVTTVEVNGGIVRIPFQRFIKILLRLFELVEMIIGQATIVVMHW